MEESTNPTGPTEATNQNAAANASRVANSPRGTAPMSLEADRPALVTFVALMMFMLGFFQVIWAIEEFANASWITRTTYGNFGGYLWLWAILDLLIAGASFYAGYDIMRGGTFGFFYGIIVAGVSAIRWFFYLPAAPVLGVVIIGIDVLIIYGLVTNLDYFRVRVTS
jgi:hypothetical protein